MSKVQSCKGFFRMPLYLIQDDRLYASDKVLLAAMLAYTGKSLCCTKTIQELAELSGLSHRTVAESLRRLQELHILREIRRYRYLLKTRKKGYASFSREIRVDKNAPYVSLPRELFSFLRQDQITPTGAVVYMAISCYARRDVKRAYASLRRLAAAVNSAVSTIKRCIKQLLHCGLICRSRCLKKNRAFSCSNTYLVYTRIAPESERTAPQPAVNLFDEVSLPEPPCQEVFSKRGRLIFAKLLVKLKITGIYNEREKGRLCSILDCLKYIEAVRHESWRFRRMIPAKIHGCSHRAPAKDSPLPEGNGLLKYFYVLKNKFKKYIS